MRLLESDTHQLGADILDIIDSLLKILASRSQTRPRHAHSYDIYRCSFLYSERNRRQKNSSSGLLMRSTKTLTTM